ncbi:hypothetical protein SBE55_10350 [Mycolicibacterium sp. 141076]|uniref:hypothetical protein n=1 Tax=Mycolicibacterium sp. 141076 TaxID=3090599 RepID=UPI00299DBF9E|nr:hypothetical protein [Mycolicibacterium sp. 141076]MDX1878218.1 hypothetical protein [Mycolicibacterium sp. 141076]
MVELPPEVEQQLSSMSDADWHALGARLRAPDIREQLRTEMAKLLGNEDNATNLASWVRTDVFTNDDGEVDPAKVRDGLTKLGLLSQPPRPLRPWRGGGTGSRGIEAAAQRFGTTTKENT